MLERPPPPAMVDLRGEPTPAFLRAAGAALGAILPTRPNTVTTAAGATVAWLGPDEWLILADGDPAPICAALEAALDGQHHAVTDVSGARALLRLVGLNARDVLSAGCSLDLDALAPGGCAQTWVARATCLVIARADGYDLLPRRSFARYLEAWLEDALVGA